MDDRSWLLHLDDCVSHTSLVADEGGKVWLLILVILGESPDVASDVGATLLWKEGERAVAWDRVLPVRHLSFSLSLNPKAPTGREGGRESECVSEISDTSVFIGFPQNVLEPFP